MEWLTKHLPRHNGPVSYTHKKNRWWHLLAKTEIKHHNTINNECWMWNTYMLPCDIPTSKCSNSAITPTKCLNTDINCISCEELNCNDSYVIIEICEICENFSAPIWSFEGRLSWMLTWCNNFKKQLSDMQTDEFQCTWTTGFTKYSTFPNSGHIWIWIYLIGTMQWHWCVAQRVHSYW